MSMPIEAHYPKREVSTNPGVSQGLSHYPQHIIAQAEAQKSQQPASGASAGSFSSSDHQQEGSTSSQNTPQGNHVQMALPPASFSEGLEIQYYQPLSEYGCHPRVANGPRKVAQILTPILLRRQLRDIVLERQAQQQHVSASVPDNSVASTSEAMPTSFVAIMA